MSRLKPWFRRGHPWTPLALAISAWLVLPAISAAETPACSECHEDLASAFTGSAHGKAFAHEGAYATASCASCHPGAAKHAESGEPADVQTAHEMDALAANTQCAACHENQGHNAFWRGSAHETANLKCTDCHAVHASSVERHGVAIATTTQLCLSCHTSMQVSMTQRSRHPLREGAIDCASCHNPHGALTEKLVKADSINDLCYSCHQEMRGPFLWEHSPVREDCLTCHAPHSSNHDKLLVARASQLCESCHLQGRHQTVAGLDASVWNSNRACLNCHSQIHGSNHPSGPLFQR